MKPGSPTIAAVATGPAAGGIGVIRVSGPQALEVVREVAPGLPAVPEPRHAYFSAFKAADGAVLDEGLALFFRGPASFTGEDVVELHCHGAPRLLRLLLELVLARGARLAEPGEFTQRAFVNGRLDLARAEAVADLVAAESEAAVRAAAAQLAGGLSRRLEVLRAPLVALHADLEAVLEYPDDAEEADDAWAARLAEADLALTALVADGVRGALVRRGARVVLFGPVNAGKSTLFNRLVGEARALVDDEPGTTRDAVEARIELDGLGVSLVDTAGLREGAGRVEALGIERTRAALAGADVAVLVVPPGAGEAEAAQWRAELGRALSSVASSAGDAVPSVPPASEGSSAEAFHVEQPWAGPRLLEVHGKADLGLPTFHVEQALAVSGQTGAGVPELRHRLAQALGAQAAGAVALTSERHLDALRRAQEAVARARVALPRSTLEVVAGELGIGLAALAEVTGEDVSAELVEAIFRRFCIGK